MTEVELIDEWAGGFGWIPTDDRLLQRTSHAIRSEDGWWLVDPVDIPALPNLLEANPVRGVVLTLDRHQRDCDSIASRYDVAIHLPEPLFYLARSFTAQTRSMEAFESATGWSTKTVIARRGWNEVALIAPGGAAVRIPESVGTAPHFCAPGERLGVHPMLRLLPPRKALGSITTERIFVGHGSGILTNGTAMLQTALETARRRAPFAYANMLRTLPRWMFGRFG